MNSYKYKLIYLPYICILLVSCSPALNGILIDTREPALNPIDFENRSIALYIAIEGVDVDSQTDYIRDFHFASGIASKLEEELELSEGAVYIYNYYPPRDSIIDTEYIKSLYRQADSDIVMLIDSVSISDSEVINSRYFIDGGDYGNNDKMKSYANKSLLKNRINVYYGATADIISQINYRDTIFWSVISKDVSFNASPIERNLTVSALGVIMNEAGRDIAGRFFDQWIPEYRYFIVYRNSVWRKAFRYAEAFEWDKAIEVWTAELGDNDRYKAACAAINISIGCEMMDQPELAIEWLDAAEQIYDIKKKYNLTRYRARLEYSIEEKKKSGRRSN